MYLSGYYWEITRYNNMIMKFYRVNDMKYENEYCMSDIECINTVTRSPIFEEDTLSTLRESDKK